MNETHPRPVSRRRYRIAAVLLIACGILSVAIHVLNCLDSAPGLFIASGAIEPSPGSVASLQPTTTEWPLIVTKQFEPGRPPEYYSLEVRGVRETSLLQLVVTGGSPEHTSALATWLTGSFTQSLRQSYATRGFAQDSAWPRVYERPNERASPLHFQSLVVAFQLLTPCLLLASGFLLLRASRPNDRNA